MNPISKHQPIMRMWTGLSVALAVALASHPAASKSIFDDDYQPPPPSHPDPSPGQSPSPSPSTPSPLEPAPLPPPRIKPTVVGPQKPVHYPLPVPSASACAEANKLVHDIYSDEFAKNTPVERAALGLKLWGEAAADTNDPMTSYVLLREAIDALQAGGDVVHGVEAVEKLGRMFAIDWQAREAEVLAVAGAKVTIPVVAHAGTQSALILSEQAIQIGRYDVSAKAAAAAVVMARKTREPGLLSWTVNWSEQAQAAQDQSKQVAASLAKLKSSPNDSAADGAAGRFLCLSCAQWERGLSLLAKSSDPLKSLAATELKASHDDATGQMAVADAWMDASAKETGVAKDAMQAHAANWYQKAIPGLNGLARMTATKRLRDAYASHLERGLVAEVYRGRYFEQKVSTRIDAAIDWDWSAIPPERGLSSYYSVRWTGWLKPSVAGNYKLIARADDAVRVWIDGKLVIDRWSTAGPDTVTLPLGTDPVALKVEYNQITGAAFIGLGWLAPGSKRPVAIPTSAYLHGPVDMEAIVPPAPTPDHDGVVTLPVWQAIVHGSQLAPIDKDEQLSFLAYWYKPTDWAGWDFTAPAGDYDVDVQLGVDANVAGGTYIVTIGGAELTGTTADTGGWESFKTETLGRVHIAGGKQTAAIKCQRLNGIALLNLQSITLRPPKADQ